MTFEEDHIDLEKDDQYHIFPPFVKRIISFDEWIHWRKSYKILFMKLFFHPNVYFYSERPPYEIYNDDDNFTEFEQKQFLIRQQYFLKNYGRVFPLFGYFAIPFIGRTGVKLSGFYTQYLKHGFLKDETIEFGENDIINFSAPPLTQEQQEKLRIQSFHELIPVVQRMQNLMRVQPKISDEMQEKYKNSE
ncbi:hypothetical protein TRFO_36722 [Tritrichomonas foetus]|uniref:Uncharacterized protein n=1 Tax=Tritrichomonas foetus TaxID=1144522 RepID=A0A1J4JDA9_9EUKA|nr:hypothetical protein TRFO_36722 [Tritrichomonas foetus]|eukprot:OHS97138.1 hypothetical protein TRFO_36722 [Tritrichomonas foetus]